MGGRPWGSHGASSSCCICSRVPHQRVVPRERVYERVWGYAMAHGDRSVDVFVRKLRKKLEAASPGWVYLHTHFGVGYRFDANEVEEVEESQESAQGDRQMAAPEAAEQDEAS